jgi:hypothetical protein
MGYRLALMQPEPCLNAAVTENRAPAEVNPPVTNRFWRE